MKRKKANRTQAQQLRTQRKRVGAFIRARRHELGYSQADLRRKLGYKSVMSIADVELGRAGLPFKRIYQYAEVLGLPRDEFLRFVMGDIQGRASAAHRPPRLQDRRGRPLSSAEQDFIDELRRLPSAYRSRIRREMRSCLSSRGRRGSSGKRG